MEAPEWWLKAHPDDVMVWDSGPQYGYAVVASPEYRRDAAARLFVLLEHLEASSAVARPATILAAKYRRMVLPGDMGEWTQRLCQGRSASVARG